MSATWGVCVCVCVCVCVSVCLSVCESLKPFHHFHQPSKSFLNWWQTRVVTGCLIRFSLLSVEFQQRPQKQKANNRCQVTFSPIHLKGRWEEIVNQSASITNYPHWVNTREWELCWVVTCELYISSLDILGRERGFSLCLKPSEIEASTSTSQNVWLISPGVWKSIGTNVLTPTWGSPDVRCWLTSFPGMVSKVGGMESELHCPCQQGKDAWVVLWAKCT